jgi:GxxExxY protein
MGDLKLEGIRRQCEGRTEEPRQNLTARIIGCAMEVLTKLGPGLLEAAYEECLCHVLAKRGIQFRRQVPIPIEFEGVKLNCGFRLDLVVEERVIVELKAIERVLPIHFCQLSTYLKLSGLTRGLIINFNVVHLRHGISRRSCFSS